MTEYSEEIGSGPNTYRVAYGGMFLLVHCDVVTHEKDGSLSFVELKEPEPKKFKRVVTICLAPGTLIEYREISQ